MCMRPLLARAPPVFTSTTSISIPTTALTTPTTPTTPSPRPVASWQSIMTAAMR